MFNSRFYYILEVLKDHLILTDKKDSTEPLLSKDNKPIKYSKNHFEVAHCITTYRYQGDTIEGKYCIFEIEKMDFNQAYTALSRGRRLSDIYFQFTAKTFKVKTELIEPTVLDNIEPKKGIIYEMHNKEQNIYYIGKTSHLNPETRLKEHQADPADPMHKYKGEWTIKTIAKCRYFGKKQISNDKVNDSELSKIETYYIRKYIEDNAPLMNAKQLPAQKIEYKMNAPKIIENKETKYSITECNGYYRVNYTNNGTLKDMVSSFKNKSKEEALAMLKGKVDDVEAFDKATEQIKIRKSKPVQPVQPVQSQYDDDEEPPDYIIKKFSKKM